MPSSGGGIDSAEALAERLAEIVTPTTVIVCVGHELRGDDAAAAAIARELAGSVPWEVFDAQTVPESFLMKIVDRKPASVVLVDALHFDAEPGQVRLVPADDIAGLTPSTHGPAPLAFLNILKMMHPAPTWVLGIQPAGTDFGAALSEPVRRAVELVVAAFHTLARRPDAK